MSADQAQSLTDILDRLEDGVDEDAEHVSVGELLDAVGRRSFAPILLLMGLIGLSPLSGIPGMPTTTAVVVLLVAGQLVFKRERFWLPRWVLRRKMKRSKLCRALRWCRKPAGFIDDHLLRRRLTTLTNHRANYAVAVICMMIAITIPPMEVVPFAATLAGAALTAFALSLIADDGLLMLIALAFTGGAAVALTQAVM